MTQDEIIEFAKRSGLGMLLEVGGMDKCLEHFAKLVDAKATAKATDEANARANASWTLMCKKMVEAEREACALICETLWNTSDNGMSTEEKYYGDQCAEAIRARGSNE